LQYERAIFIVLHILQLLLSFALELLIHRMRIISFANNKGGVGKTTSALSVAHTLHKQGKRVLLIDADPQANTSKTFAVDHPLPGLGALLDGKVSLTEVADEISPGFHLLRSGGDLARQEKVLGSQPDYVFALREMLASAGDVADYVVIDTPPNLGPLTVASLVASHDVFIPLKPEFFANEGMAALMDMVVRLHKGFAPLLRVSGIFFTEYAPSYRRALHHQVVAAIKQDPQLLPLVMQTTIRENVSLPESQSVRQGIHDWAPLSNAAVDYQALTKEILAIIAIRAIQ
jgi:chromosome partitioning protein